MSIPISVGSGAASVAAEAVGGLQYQRIQTLGAGGSSVMAVNPDGSINVSVLGAINVTGSVSTVFQGSVLATIQSSVITVWQSSSVIARVTGSVVALPASGSVIAVLSDSSIIARVTGSVVALPASGSVITVWSDSSVIARVTGSVVALPASGSVITVWSSPSIVGTYAEDTAHVVDSKGLFNIGVRNDTMASVTSATGDYTQMSVGPSGETLVAQAPLTKWVQGVADLRVVLGSSVQAIAPLGASIFTYIQAAQVANFGPSSVLVKFTGGLGSTLGWTIAPAGGGSNIIFKPALKTGENSGFSASINGTASVIVSAQGFGASI